MNRKTSFCRISSLFTGHQPFRFFCEIQYNYILFSCIFAIISNDLLPTLESGYHQRNLCLSKCFQRLKKTITGWSKINTLSKQLWKTTLYYEFLHICAKRNCFFLQITYFFVDLKKQLLQISKKTMTENLYFQQLVTPLWR